MTEEDALVYPHGAWAEATRHRLDDLKTWYLRLPGRTLVAYSILLATMLLGVIVGRRRWLHDPGAHRDAHRRALLWGLGLGVVLAVVFGVLLPRVPPVRASVLGLVVHTSYSFQRPCLMAAYAAALALLWLRPRPRRVLQGLAPVGRMPLTNYLAQSVFFTLVFYGYGLGFYGRCPPSLGLVLGLAFFGLQVWWSRAWFRAFDYGPAEWLWRAATYGTPPRLRRPAAAPAATA